MASAANPVNARTLRVSRGYEAAAPVRFSCDGAALTGLAGESVAASLVAAGRAAFHPDGAANPRGVFCGMGVCRECLVSIDGRHGVRACMTPLAEGMRVETRAAVLAGSSAAPAVPHAERVETPDVLVIGGGPAGLCAARAAAAAGARVVLLDERSSLGGQYFKPLAASHRFLSRPDRQFSEGMALVEAVRAAGVKCIRNAVVWGAFPALELAVLVKDQPVLFRPRRLVLATGALERAVPLPGWTLAGCMTTGAAQALVRANRVAPGQRVVVSGNGPLNWQLAAELLAAGVRVVAVAEAAPRFAARDLPVLLRMFAADGARTFDGARLLARLLGLLAFGTVVSAAHGTDCVEAVTLARIDGDGNAIPGSESRIEADTLCMGYGFIAASELARALGCRHEPGAPGTGLRALRDAQCRSSVAEIYIAGDGAGMGGAAAAMAEGVIAGTAAAADLGHAPLAARTEADAAQAALARHRCFQSALWRLFRAPALGLQFARDDTVVCRCENVTLGALRTALAAGGLGLGGLKRQTRAGMGRCQGRYCGALLNEAMGGPAVDEFAMFAPRPPARPVPIGWIARERPEE